jgi:DNA polymerase elongation subunit (family B)
MNLPFYGFDIETTSLSPIKGRTRSVAAWGDAGYFYAEAPESEGERGLILGALGWLVEQEPGVVVGWNTSGFDVPFMLSRGRSVDADLWSGGHLLLATPAEDRPLKYEPVEGHTGGYRVQSFAGHRHCDIMNAWKPWCGANGVEWSLKAVAEACGLNPIKENREAMDDLNSDRLRSYNLSDSRVTKGLAELLGSREFAAWVD